MAVDEDALQHNIRCAAFVVQKTAQIALVIGVDGKNVLRLLFAGLHSLEPFEARLHVVFAARIVAAFIVCTRFCTFAQFDELDVDLRNQGCVSICYHSANQLTV